jgi:predicted kinase
LDYKRLVHWNLQISDLSPSLSGAVGNAVQNLECQIMSDPESTASNLNLASEKRIRLIRPSVVVLCGPAACGKSTFAACHFRPTQVISSDHAWSLVCDDETDQRHSAEAFRLVNFIIEQRLSINRLCVVDSTALTPEARRTLLDLAHKHGVTCVVFLFDTPLETCIARDQARERSVGRLVIERQYHIFERERNNLEREGFDQIIALLEDDLDKVRIDVLFRPIPKPLKPTGTVQARQALFQSGGPRPQGWGGHRHGPVSTKPAPSPAFDVSQSAASSAVPQSAAEPEELPSSRPPSPAPRTPERS